MLRILARKEKELWFLIPTIFVFFLLRFPSLFEPYWYGDEGIYQTIGKALNHGKLLYRDTWDNKPPLLYLVYGLFQSDQFIIRFISLLFGIAAVVVFFALTKKLFDSKENHVISITTIIFVFLFGIPLLEGNIANAENFMLFPTLLAAFYLFSYLHTKKSIFLVFVGLLLSVSFLFKIVAAFDTAAFVLFIFFSTYNGIKNVLTQVKNILPFFISFSIPILLTGLFFLIKGAFSYFYQGSFTQMVGYVGYGNTFLIPQGFLILKSLLLISACYVVFRQRKRLGERIVFILLWFIFSLFNAFFAGRPYTHYMLVLLPSFVLFFGLLLSNNLPSQAKKGLTVLFVIILLIVVDYFNFFQKSVFYYQNFISFVTHKKSVYEYQAFFDGNTPKDYETAQYINMHAKTHDSIFVWGNNAQLYKLTNKLPPGRLTVAYHMTASQKTLRETQISLSRVGPKYIIVTLHDPSFPFQLANYAYRISINEHVIYERIY